MKTIAIDTNVVLAFRLKREPGFNQAKDLFQQCLDGKINLFLASPILLETEWVLRSTYKQAKEGVVAFLENLLAIDHLLQENKQESRLALNFYKINSKVSFTDCVIAQQVHSREYEFLTFDKDLEKLFQSL